MVRTRASYSVSIEETCGFASGPVKIRGTVDSVPIRTAFMALGDGQYKLRH
jgi:hypothetical protein